MGETLKRSRIGVTGEGLAVIVTLEIEPLPGEHETVTHGRVDGVTRVSLHGETIKAGARSRHEIESAGQIVETLAEVTDYAGGWDADSVARLAELWDAHHLNDMRAGCAHQTPVGDDVATRLDNTPACPVTGYRYGHGWLVDDPETTAAGVAELLALPWEV